MAISKGIFGGSLKVTSDNRNIFEAKNPQKILKLEAPFSEMHDELTLGSVRPIAATQSCVNLSTLSSTCGEGDPCMAAWFLWLLRVPILAMLNMLKHGAM